MKCNIIQNYDFKNDKIAKMKILRFKNDNITFFDEVNDMNIKSAIEAAKIVKLPFFENYQESKNMLLTKKAKELSSGQKQRLVLARAFYQNKSIIIISTKFSCSIKKI